MLNRFFFALAFVLPVLGHAQAINGDFELGFFDGTTMGWSTPEPSGANTTNDALSGKKAAKAWVFTYYNIGSWVSFTPIDNLVPAGGSAPILPKKLTGYYKYEGETGECDAADIKLIVGKRGDDGQVQTLAIGATELKLSSRYRYFEFPINGEPGPEAEFISIQFNPAGRCNNHGSKNCCFLFVDDLKLSPNPDEATETKTASVIETPKPQGTVITKTYRPTGRAKSSGRKAKKKNRKDGGAANAPVPVPPSAANLNAEKEKKAAPTAEEKIPAEIQKEIDRIRQVQDEEEQKRQEIPATIEEEEGVPVEPGFESDESSDD